VGRVPRYAAGPLPGLHQHPHNPSSECKYGLCFHHVILFKDREISKIQQFPPFFGECFSDREEVVIAELTEASNRAQKQTPPAASRLNEGGPGMLKVPSLHFVCWSWL